jgi:hypothetical protein
MTDQQFLCDLWVEWRKAEQAETNQLLIAAE